MEMDDGSQARTLLEIWKRIVSKQFESIERAKYDGGNPEAEKKQYAECSEELGNLYIDFENNLAAAKEQFVEAYKYNSNKYSLLLDIAQIEYLLQNIDEAQANCTKVLRIEPNNGQAL